MNVSKLLTCLLALFLLPLWAEAQSVRPYISQEVLQTDTFEHDYITFGFTMIVKAPAHADYYEIVNVGGGIKTLVYSPEDNFVGRDSILVEYWPTANGPKEYLAYAFLVQQSTVTAVPDYASTTINTPITIDVLANDLSSQGTLECSAVALERFGTTDIVGDQIEFTPETDFTGIAQLVYVTCDDLEHCDQGVVNIHVKPTSLALTDTSEIQMPKDSPFDIMLLLDGYDSIDDAPTNGTLSDVTNDVVRYTPNPGFTGTDEFTVIHNIAGSDHTRTFEIEVFDVLPPQQYAMKDIYYMHRNDTLSFNVLDNDIGGYNVLNSGDIQVNSGSLTYLGNGDFIYVPAFNKTGVIKFDYEIGSPSQGQVVETGKVEIIISDFKPQLPTYSLQTAENKPLVIRYGPPVEPWTFDESVPPLDGEVIIHSGQQTINLEAQNITGYNLVVYTPDLNYTGLDEFELEYCVSGICEEVKFVINVIPDPNPGDPQCLADCVWPGDANKDGIVNVRDLLPIGLSMGIQGLDRDNPTTDWIPQFSDNWDDPFDPSPFDLKHIDTDGNGMINAEDTLAISESYLNMHQVTSQLEHRLNQDLDLRFVVRDTSTYGPDTILILDIYYGLSSKPAYDAHGFSFEIDFADVVAIEPEHRIRTEYYEDSWLSLQKPHLSLFKRLGDYLVHGAYTKTDGETSVGYGPVGFVIVDDVEGIRPDRLRAAYTNGGRITVRNITVMTTSGETFLLPDQVIQLNASDAPMASTLEHSDLHVFPNPAAEQATIYLDGQLIRNVQVLDLNGRMVHQSGQVQSPRYDIPVGHYQNGLYLLRVTTNDGTRTTKLEIMH